MFPRAAEKFFSRKQSYLNFLLSTSGYLASDRTFSVVPNRSIRSPNKKVSDERSYEGVVISGHVIRGFHELRLV